MHHPLFISKSTDLSDQQQLLHKHPPLVEKRTIFVQKDRHHFLQSHDPHWVHLHDLTVWGSFSDYESKWKLNKSNLTIDSDFITFKGNKNTTPRTISSMSSCDARRTMADFENCCLKTLAWIFTSRSYSIDLISKIL